MKVIALSGDARNANWAMNRAVMARFHNTFRNTPLIGPSINLFWPDFRERLNSLRNDIGRAFVSNDFGCAPFPVAMYSFATIDYFSSHWMGLIDPANQSSNSNRNQTQRMADFLKQYLEYPPFESQLAINLYRHKLMHTAEPRSLKEKDGSKSYDWLLADRSSKHWTIENRGDAPHLFHCGLWNLLDDLERAVFSPSGYFKDLTKDSNLQGNWKRFHTEMDSYSFEYKL